MVEKTYRIGGSGDGRSILIFTAIPPLIFFVAVTGLVLELMIGEHDPKSALVAAAIGYGGIGVLAYTKLRVAYIDVLRGRNEEVQLGTEELVHINYSGIEDFRSRYEDIVGAEKVAWVAGDVTPRWLLSSSAGKSFELRSDLKMFQELKSELEIRTGSKLTIK